MTLTNWAGNLTFGARTLHRPQSVPELCQTIAASPRIRALGAGHSFSPVADTDADLVSLAALPSTMDIDTDEMTVTIAAGVRYGELAPYLHRHGFALPNLASLPHLTVAGACATGTHGSGVSLGSLATSVSAMEVAGPDGSLTRLTDPAPVAVHLGALGIVTALTLKLVPTFDISQRVYEDIPRHLLHEALGAAYSASLFTDWRTDRFTQLWLKQRDSDPQTGALGRPADGPRHPIASMPADACTEQLGVPGPWHLRLPHFRMDHTPSAGDELQSEYFVPTESALAALAAIDPIRDTIASVLQISEIRAVAADNLWLSPAYQRDSVAIHFTWIKDTTRVMPIIAALEKQLAPFAARPHWAKLFTTPPAVLAGLYDRHADFIALAAAHDPTAKFRNAFLNHYLTAPTGHV